MPVINKTEIPQDVLEDIYNQYEVIKLDNYGETCSKECVSRLSNYYTLIEQGVSKTVVNPETFEPEIKHGVNVVERYVLRGVFTANTADIYSVTSSHHMELQNDDHVMDHTDSVG